MKIIQKPYKNNEFKVLGLKWNENPQLPDRSFSVSDIQDYFEYIIKKLETFTDNLPIKIYVNKIENKIRFRLKIGYYLERLMPEAMKLLGSAKITKDENGKNEPHLKITEVVLVHCNIVSNDNLKPCIHLLQLNRLFNY